MVYGLSCSCGLILGSLVGLLCLVGVYPVWGILCLKAAYLRSGVLGGVMVIKSASVWRQPTVSRKGVWFK